jgi:luciferase family oxidoreductase group 1
VLTLSVLDQSPIPQGTSPSEALANTVELAQLAERLGYRRYWLAEHHATAGLAGSAPEVLIAHVAAHTSTIRVGSGGVMLPHYSPLKVVEQFRVLHALHPGRIDLGLGRAPGSDSLTALALQRDRKSAPADDFGNQMAELMAWLDGGFPDGHPFRPVTATPVTPGGPELWLLSSSGYSAMAAATFGVAFCFAHFINPEAAEQSMALYREHFKPSATLDQPRASLAVSVICADTDEEAERLAASIRLWRLRLLQGDPGPVPPVEEALAYGYTGDQRRRLDAGRSRLVVGGPDRVAERLHQMAESYGVDEIMAVTITHDHAARLHSYELLASAVGAST